MNINQVNLSYVAPEDRLLLRLNTKEQAEFRLWITRALARGLLQVIDQTAGQLGETRVSHIGLDPQESKRLALAQETSQADFATPFSEQAGSYPLGEAPRLVLKMHIEMAEGRTNLQMELDRNQRFDLSLDRPMFLAIARMLIRLLDTLDWGLTARPAAADPAAPPHALH